MASDLRFGEDLELLPQPHFCLAHDTQLREPGRAAETEHRVCKAPPLPSATVWAGKGFRG